MPVIKPISKEKAQSASKLYYDKTKMLILQRKLYKRIANGRMPHPRTIMRLGLRIEDGEVKGWDQSILEPKTFTFEKAKPVENVLVHAPAPPAPLPAGEVSSADAVAHIQKTKKTKDTTKAKYNQLPKLLTEGKFIKSQYSDNILPILKNPEPILIFLKDKYFGGTRHQIAGYRSAVQVFVNVIENNDIIKDGIGQDAVDKWINAFTAAKKGDKDLREKRIKEDQVYDWGEILEGVKKHSKSTSLGYCFLRVYDWSPVRTELDREVPVVKTRGDKKSNYLLDNGDGTYIFHDGDFKTNAAYPDGIDYKYPADVNKLLHTSFKKYPRKVFWKTGIFTQAVFDIEYAGFEKFPFGTGSDKPSKDDIVRGLRHTVATFYNRKDYKGDHPTGSALAHLMNHDLGTSRDAYQNTELPPLKPLVGKSLKEYQEKLEELF